MLLYKEEKSEGKTLLIGYNLQVETFAVKSVES